MGRERWETTHFTMHKVLAQPLSSSADPTIPTMIDALPRIVVPQLTYITIIPRRPLATLVTILASRLWGAAQHAQHILRGFAVEVVRGDCSIVAVAAGMPGAAVVALDLDVAFVVGAAEDGFGAFYDGGRGG
jgi:hypothetical protein